MKCVVARYQEGLEWIGGIQNALVYNKGGDNIPNTSHPIIQLPNVGREGHTFLHHIIANYDQLDPYTVFLQGYPFDHCPYLEDVLKELKRDCIDSPNPTLGVRFLSRELRYANLMHDDTGPHIPLIDCYQKIFNQEKIDHHFFFAPGAQFVASRSAIRSRSKQFYQTIYDMLNKEVNPIEGYALERFWPMILMHLE